MFLSSRSARSFRLLLAAVAAATIGPLTVGVAPAASADGPGVTLSQDVATRTPGAEHTVTASVTGSDGQPAPDGTTVTFTISGPANSITLGSPVVGVALSAGNTGGWKVRSDGGVDEFGTATAVTAPAPVASPAIDLAATPTGAGYWVTTAAGHVLTAGDATAYGDLRNVQLNGPILRMTPTPTGKGYWMVGSDGGVFTFGDARFLGTMGGTALPKPTVGLVSTPTGAGYWLWASNGAMYPFGDAASFGDLRNLTLNKPIVDVVATPTGKGYWMVAGDGGIFSFGDSRFMGSTGAVKLNGPVTRMTRSANGSGYVMVTRDGTYWSFGVPELPNIGAVYPVKTVNGKATLRFTSSTVGESTVGASVAPSTTATPVTVRWVSGPPATIRLTVSPTGGVLTSETANVVAIVKDADGLPANDGTAVTFSAAGTGAEDPASTTVLTSSGEARFAVRSTAPGHSQVVATIADLSATAGIDWRQPAPDLALSLSATPQPVGAGSEVSFAATVSSNGPIAAPGAWLNITLPGASSIGPAQAGSSCSVLADTLRCHLGVMPNPSRTVVRFAATWNATGSVKVSAEVTPEGDQPDLKPGDNTVERTIQVLAAPTTVALTQSNATEVVGEPHPVTITSDGADGTLVTVSVDAPAGPLAGRPFAAFAASPDGNGYWLAGASGQIVARGSATAYAEAGPLSSPVVDLRSTPTGKGYWITTADGAVVARGDAVNAGSLAGTSLSSPIIGMGVTPTGKGYWLASAKGEVFPFGDALNAGSLGWVTLSAPIVSFEPTPSGKGYRLLASNGGMYTFGDAAFFGSLGAVTLTSPLSDLTVTPTGNGYWIVDEVGKVYSFGDAVNYGNVTDQTLGGTIAGLTPTSAGYWLFGRNGAVFAFGKAKFMGPMTTATLKTGRATVKFTSTRTGTTEAIAAAVRPGGLVTSTTLSMNWTPATTGTLSVNPAASTVTVGVQQQLVATLTDPSGAPVADGTVVSFALAGPVSGPATRETTTAGGTATLGFTASEPGTTTVTARSGDLQATATVEWKLPPTAPSAPRSVEATPGDSSAVVSWRAPSSNGGSAVFRYTVTASPGGRSVDADGLSTSATVSGLQNGTAYTFTVKATNAAGTSPASAPSSAVTPKAGLPGGGGTGGTGGGDTGGTGGGSTGGGTGGTGGSNPGAGDAGDGGSGSARPARSGYWMLGAGGAVYAFGDVVHHGQPTLAGGVEAVDLEPTPSSGGYWVVDSNGAVHAFGDARHLGDLDRRVLVAGEKVTSLSATPSGAGYWIFTTRGRVLPFGDAAFLGDVSNVKLNGPVLDSIPTPSGLGYYMVAADGGIFTFGDAKFVGSMGGKKLNEPVQSLVPDGDGHGYWLVASDGGIFAFDAPFRGSLGAVKLNKPVKGMVRYGNGYLMVATDGGIFAFSDQPFAGSLGATPPNRPIVSVAAAR